MKPTMPNPMIQYFCARCGGMFNYRKDAPAERKYCDDCYGKGRVEVRGANKQRPVMCLICKKPYDDEPGDKPFCPDGVCPTCRRHAEIGKRVEEMKPAKAFYSDPSDWDKGFLIGYNRCLLEAKGEKP